MNTVAAPTSIDTDTRILRLKEVLKRTGLGKTMIYELQAQGRFPRRIQLSERAVGWLQQDVDAWVRGRTSNGSAS